MAKTKRRAAPPAPPPPVIQVDAAGHTQYTPQKWEKTLRNNLPFDGRMLSGSRDGGTYARGRLYNINPMPGPDGTGTNTYILHFLYNPAGISFNYSTDDSAMPDYAKMQTQLTPIENFLQGVTTSFQLYFDRTYEVLFSKDTVGMLRDVRVFELMFGVLRGGAGASSPQVQVVCGPISFVGFITGATVAYTHFSKDMIPLRGAINADLAVQYRSGTTSNTNPATGPTDGGSGGTTPSAPSKVTTPAPVPLAGAPAPPPAGATVVANPTPSTTISFDPLGFISGTGGFSVQTPYSSNTLAGLGPRR